MIEINITKELTAADVAKEFVESSPYNKASFILELAKQAAEINWKDDCYRMADEFEGQFGRKRMRNAVWALETMIIELKIMEENQ